MVFPIVIVIQHLQENGFPSIMPTASKKYSLEVKNITKTKSDILNGVMLNFSFFRSLQNYFMKSYAQDIKPSGTAQSSRDVGLKTIKVTILTLILCLIFSMV
ncbi:MAG: hypothetical protein MJK05_05925, partial [Nitrosopumilus sp.]|nr:hypothetical protein [Nitrosopumilus sp.]